MTQPVMWAIGICITVLLCIIGYIVRGLGGFSELSKMIVQQGQMILQQGKTLDKMETGMVTKDHLRAEIAELNVQIAKSLADGYREYDRRIAALERELAARSPLK
jgi:hypothetical protein